MTNQSERFAALADPTRREIFEKLAKKPLAVGEIAEGLPVTRPAVSQHLKILKEAGLVTMRTEGTRNVKPHPSASPFRIDASAGTCPTS